MHRSSLERNSHLRRGCRRRMGAWRPRLLPAPPACSTCPTGTVSAVSVQKRKFRNPPRPSRASHTFQRTRCGAQVQGSRRASAHAGQEDGLARPCPWTRRARRGRGSRSQAAARRRDGACPPVRGCAWRWRPRRTCCRGGAIRARTPRGSLPVDIVWLQAGVERLKQKLDEANAQNRKEMETALKSMQWQLRTCVCPRSMRAARARLLHRVFPLPAVRPAAGAVTFLFALHQAAGPM